MPNSVAKKSSSDKEQALPADASQCDEANNQLNTSGSSTNSAKARKRKHCEILRFSDLESEFEDCDLEDAVALETKLRKVARRNSLSHDEMIKLLHKFVKNEHILALVTLKAEDEMAREKAKAEERAIIITDTPSIPKLTRAKAKALNKTPVISLPKLLGAEQPEIATLIDQELNSDEDDEEYTFKEEDFVSDDDPNATASDLDSNPRTPLTPATPVGQDYSPIKLTEDGCFKVPLNRKEQQEELLIATRTRSKLCLEQTTIEDIESEFVPPDIEASEGVETDAQCVDEEWQQFLTDFLKPLNSSLVGDDDDPINDPEYIAAEKEKVDAEELRDVNISKKEIAELMTELLSNLNEGISLESIELETPRKFLLSYDRLNTPNTSPERLEENPVVTSQLEVSEHESLLSQSCAISSSNVTQPNLSFHPDVMSTPTTLINHNHYVQHSENENMAVIPVALPNQDTSNSLYNTVAISTDNLNTQVDLIALPIPGQANCYQLAKVVNSTDTSIITTQSESPTVQRKPQSSGYVDKRYSKPYETNYSAAYISVKRHAIAEYIDKFESLKHAQVNQVSSTTSEAEAPALTSPGFSKYQYDLLQQQMRIHVQMLTQTYVQTYCHPELWRMAKKPKEMLLELQTKSRSNDNFKIWNLEKAIDLTNKWQSELDQDTEENKELMEFLHREVQLTNHNTRQIPRFHPRMMECFLESDVFMYPQYLPRIPFSPKMRNFEVFSPVESYLIAMGLEKHMKIITERKEKVHIKSTPLRLACRRLTKDTLIGKDARRVWDHTMNLKNADYYNPIKYYFEHNKAPPVEHTPIIGFENNVVLAPKHRYQELPLVFQNYLEKKQGLPKRNKKIVLYPRVKASDEFRNSYLEFVREAVGEDVSLPQNCDEGSQEGYSTSVICSNLQSSNTAKKRKQSKKEPRAKRTPPRSLTINVNYVFGGAAPNNATIAPAILQPLIDSTTPLSNLNASISTTQTSNDNGSLRESTINQSIIPPLDIVNNNLNDTQSATDTPLITYNFDLTTQTLQPSSLQDIPRSNLPKNIENVVDSASSEQRPDVDTHISNKISKVVQSKRKRRKKIQIYSYITKLHRHTFKRAEAYRDKQQIKQRCLDLITAYGIHLETLQARYEHSPLVQQFYCRFKALELYTNLLKSLKMICSKNSSAVSAPSSTSNATAGCSPSSLKRTRNSHVDDESSPSSQRMARKINRQEENFRHMLLPDNPEETNRKDAIYAFNFYEKVEEAFRSSNRPDDCKKFNFILKSFDPKVDKVSELYYKLEKLFLPDHPELAQVFLTFLMPSEAAEIGKFFEHFMISNMSTFINKLNIYFNKQPAQIRKIYNCLNELADDPDVTMKKIESKIVPLLKGNQFLIDWFMQQFPKSAPPERLFSAPEHILNVKEQQSNRPSEHVETLTDLQDSPAVDANVQQTCQLRYINGRIFYGSKILLPAKLSFIATSCRDNRLNTCSPPTSFTGCAHAIKEHGEKRLQSASELATVVANTDSTDDQDKSEEDDVSKALIIDTTAEEDDSCSSFEPCDENTLKAHALRLNPSYYGSACYMANASSTPNLNNYYQGHHPNAKKVSLNFNDDTSGVSAPASGNSGTGKTSPRKNTNQNQHSINSPSSTTCQSPVNAREKRKSPIKKTKSPLSTAVRSVRSFNQPMVVIHENSSAIQCAKRLKSLVDGPSEKQNDPVEETFDSKEHIHIVARSKHCIKSSTPTTNSSTTTPNIGGSSTVSGNKNCNDLKQENSDDLEFLTESTSITRSPFPTLKMDTDSNEEDGVTSKTATRVDSEDDCKIDIVASLATEPSKSNETSSTILHVNSAWTRDEDKTILIEMKLGSQNREELYQRISRKLPQRNMYEITERHQFLMDFLSKLQGK